MADRVGKGHPRWVTSSSIRAALGESRRLVVKVGSRALMDGTQRFESLAAQLSTVCTDGRMGVLVSSGAVALGREVLGLSERPTDLGVLQAAAALGQSVLMERYIQAFAPHHRPVAQLLLSHADLADRERFLNARQALESLVQVGAVPVVNENDTVAVDEIRFGDNDQLAAMVTTLFGADLLVLLTNVDGVYDEQGERIRVAGSPEEVAGCLRDDGDDVGRGGMRSKVDAARRATRHGTTVLIADASMPNVLPRIIAGEDVGTLFLPEGAALPSRKAWIAYTLRPKGTLVIDPGAEAALAEGASLLSAGVVAVRGDFVAGDAVEVQGATGIVGRGLARCDLTEVARLAGTQGEVLVHRNDLVIL